MRKATFNIHGLKAKATISNLDWFLISYMTGRMTEETASKYIGRPVEEYQERMNRLHEILDCEFLVSIE